LSPLHDYCIFVLDSSISKFKNRKKRKCKSYLLPFFSSDWNIHQNICSVSCIQQRFSYYIDKLNWRNSKYYVYFAYIALKIGLLTVLNLEIKMKKSTILFIIFTAFSILIGSKLQAQMKVLGHISAEVINSLSAMETAQLNFGRFAPQSAGGQVIITPQGAQLSTGTIALSSGTHNAASFYFSGEAGALFSVSLPSGPVQLTNTQNSKTMTIINWVSGPQQGIGIVIPEGGGQVVNVGATLVAGTTYDNPVGIYTGTYAITFGYN
jgi:hypothetical protein